MKRVAIAGAAVLAGALAGAGIALGGPDAAHASTSHSGFRNLRAPADVPLLIVG